MQSFWLAQSLLVLHVTANLVWIGAILSSGFLLARAAREPETGTGGKALAASALLIYKRVATPAFGVSFVAGLGRVGLSVSTYMHAHWFHGKLTLALVVIALHHVLGARAKKAHAGSMQSAKSGGILSLALLCASTLTVLLVLFKAALVP